MPFVGEPMAYFITFRTYGSWLHGDDRGSVQRGQATDYGSELLASSAKCEDWERSRLKSIPRRLDPLERRIVGQAVLGVCEARGWTLAALNVRTNHVHLVVGGEGVAPERIMNDVKAYSTRALRRGGRRPSDERVWSRHGSTRYLWSEEDVAHACWYVAERQNDKGESPSP